MCPITAQTLLRPDAPSGEGLISSGLSDLSSPIESQRTSVHLLNHWWLFVIAFAFLIAPSAAKASTYYLSPYGSDSNSGSSSSASWLSPNHPLNCGDVIVAAASTAYSATNFYTGKWGTVNCPAGNSVAWLKCAQFDACKIYTNTNEGMWVDRSYWGVQGWEVTTSASDTYGTCFSASPRYSAPAEIHHIIFADDIANGCSQGGFAVINRGDVGVDYFTLVGSIAYNTAQGSATCTSGISIYQPIQSDSKSGTHIYLAGNFSYANLEPSECAGRTPTDGEGIIFDSFDGDQGGLPTPYAAQAVAYNNILIDNGGRGIEINNNSTGSNHATIRASKNTIWGDFTDPHQSWVGCGEISVYRSSDTILTDNLISTKSATGCGGNPVFALAVSTSDGSDSVEDNFAYGYNGNNTFLYSSGSFSWGNSNHFGQAPDFSNPTVPGAPNCGGAANVPGCMASVVADFAPKAGASSVGFGYQKPSSSSVNDPLFPKWLCTAGLPSGLVTLGCN
jgi:hypothetical protein